ncbi:hypothetical protein [Desulfovibrio desulfuricans]|uniref:hypothetical protein n=1 Tax=Desulfovibrio desulfuricans TaxID=876 RepID=UPI001AE740AD|nr:hypothetical protein [Desulfovibrio desulfuricans]QTO39961.1 hypothetical protein J8J02_12785 [Desulfovibrio desulfuricans]
MSAPNMPWSNDENFALTIAISIVFNNTFFTGFFIAEYGHTTWNGGEYGKEKFRL